MTIIRPVTRSAKSGRFVSKAEANAEPEATIKQTPIRMNGKNTKALADEASRIAGRQIEPHIVTAVIRAYRKLSRAQ